MKHSHLYAVIALAIFAVSCKNEAAPPAPVAEPAKVEAVPRRARRYIADTTATYVQWTGSKPTGKHTGTIGILLGKLYTMNDTLTSGRFTLNMKSIRVTDPASGPDKINLENHLKGLGKEADADHFFNTLKYPTGKFIITGITRENGKTFIEGNLTLKEITHNLKFPATVSVAPDSIVITSETFRINRTLWNINYSSKGALSNIGDKYINDDIELRVTVKARH